MNEFNFKLVDGFATDCVSVTKYENKLYRLIVTKYDGCDVRSIDIEKIDKNALSLKRQYTSIKEKPVEFVLDLVIQDSMRKDELDDIIEKIKNAKMSIVELENLILKEGYL